ncbi:hypothetical protein [Vulcanisaeta thermophila]|uniref:hypothetical protein n=1 Tax=Vulcanisaeta thermophila TaxID=867917 RepID=UPI001180526F|nr:hypothetical protein [Vulcanisaeta thermophila]
MSHLDYLASKIRSEVQDTVDSTEKLITMIVGISAVGPAAVFVLSTLMGPFLILLVPLIFSLSVLLMRRVLLRFTKSLTNELLSGMDVHDDTANLLRSSRILMGLIDSGSPRTWFYILSIINGAPNDLLGSLITKEVYGDMDRDGELLAKHVLSIGSSLNKLIISVVNRGVRTITISYYVLIYSIPIIARTLTLLGIHWSEPFLLMSQLLIILIMYISIRLLRRVFDINVNQKLFFTASMGAILMSLLLLA